MRSAGILLLLFLNISVFVDVHAQSLMGMSGLLNTPTAENVEGGRSMAGINYLPKESLPAYFTNQYNSANYYINISMFSFLEVSYRMTMLKGKSGKMNEQDRSYSIKLRPISEGKYRPGLAIGTTDPFNDGGENAYESYYGVITKGFNLKGSRLSLSIGSYLSLENDDYRKQKFGTVFGGLSFVPGFCKNIKLIGEYDSNVYNAGVELNIFKCLNLNAFMYDMKHLSAGIRYEYVLKH